jgi:2-(1,2-epoxy-1,2-dihydrophenyl)acetyl-CoA isomerase
MTVEILNLRESRLTLEAGVAEFAHQRPVRRNPISMELRQDYADMLDRIEGDPAVRALVIFGEGGVFCAGGDLKGLKERLASADPAVNSAEAMQRRVGAAHVWFGRLRDLPIPVVAAVDGAAFGAGLSLALAADFVLASTRARFAASFIRIGMLPDLAALHTLPRLIGLAAAKEMMFTGRALEAQEARALGLVHAIYPPELLREQARAFAARFVGASAHALAQTKRMLNRSFESSYETVRDFEASGQGIASTTPAHAAALERFIQGEPPLFDWDRMGPDN